MPSTQTYLGYEQHRNIRLPRLIERLTKVYGMPDITFAIDDESRPACRLTSGGVKVIYSPERVAALCDEALPVYLADSMAICHQINRAKLFMEDDFECDPGYDFDHSWDVSDQARRFFFATLDDIRASAALQTVPLFEPYLSTFLFRVSPHVIIDLPRHIQFMHALRARCTENEPLLHASAEVMDALNKIEVHAADASTNPLTTMASASSSYRDRMDAARRFIWPHYIDLYFADQKDEASASAEDLYADASLFGEAAPADPDSASNKHDGSANNERGTQDEDSEIGVPAPYRADAQIATRYKWSTMAVPQASTAPDDLELVEQRGAGYQACIANYRKQIHQMADLLLKLSSPTQTMPVPRWRHSKGMRGTRLHPNAIERAFIGLETATDQPVWQPIEMKVKSQALEFNGLDIFLLLDVSRSMRGVNALYASTMAACLMEGLQLACHRAERDQHTGIVDVRVQLVAFGLGWVELTPLARSLSQAQKETAWFNLMNPESDFTTASGALKHVRDNARSNSKRNVLCLVLSDGHFFDGLGAAAICQKMPKNVYLGHINIGELPSDVAPITTHREIVSDPSVLPQRLQAILQDYIDGSLAQSTHHAR